MELYLLRNSKRTRRWLHRSWQIHPEFILWLLIDGKQHVIFADPKGNPKPWCNRSQNSFFQTIKDIEKRLGDPIVQLHSFIVSNTPSHTMRLIWRMAKLQMFERHIVIQEEDKETYVCSILEQITS